MYYTEMTMWLQKAINNLQEPTRTIITILLYMCVPLLIIILIWFANKQEEKN